MCFSLEFLKAILILAIVIVATIAILKLLVPFIASKLGMSLGEGWNLCVAIFRIFIWAIILIVIVIFAFQLISCLWSYVGGAGLLPRR